MPHRHKVVGTTNSNNPSSSTNYYQRMDLIDHRAINSNNGEEEEEEEELRLSDGHHDNTNVPFYSYIHKYYSNIHLLIELIFCILIAGLGHDAPSIIFGLSLTERPIPYQQTANGDILLDLYINRDYITYETIPNLALVLLVVILPLLIIVSYSTFFGYHHDVHSSACFYLFAFGCTTFITTFVKLYVGYWRPNFYNYCQFDNTNLDCEADNDRAIYDSRKSFPSGHASTSFCCMTSLTLFFLGKVGLYCSYYFLNDTSLINSNNNNSSSRSGMNNHHETMTDTTKSMSFLLVKKRLLNMIVSSPMFLAVFIAASRVHDDMHHPADVVAGSLIGLCCSLFSYFLW